MCLFKNLLKEFWAKKFQFYMETPWHTAESLVESSHSPQEKSLEWIFSVHVLMYINSVRVKASTARYITVEVFQTIKIIIINDEINPSALHVGVF
jgi:hypothetical protein